MRKRGSFTLAIEVRESIRVEEYFRSFVLAAERGRAALQVYVAVPNTPDGEELVITLETDRSLRDLGIGVLLVDGMSVDERRRARPQSLRYVIAPGPSVGKYKVVVDEAIAKFNDGQPIDAIRDMTETVEGQVRALAKKAAKKGKINMRVKDVDTLDLEGLVNCLGSSEYRGRPQTRILEPTFATDIRSFKSARNLSHHPRSTRQQRALHTQMYERMEMAVRLIRELNRIHRTT
jgi:hypothetical protein